MRRAYWSALALGLALAAAVAGTALSSGGGQRAAATASPLDPLSGAELLSAFRTIQASRRFPKGAFFPLVELQEPPKAQVLAWSPGKPFQRRAFAQVYDRARNRLF